VAAKNAGEKNAVTLKNMPMLSLSGIFVVAFLQQANAQQIDALSNAMDIRILAEGVPKFDIGGGCRVDNMSSSLDAGLDEPIKRCMQDEQRAQDQLRSRWSQLAVRYRVVCIGEAYDASGMPPSYVVLSACLLGSGLAKNPNN
jgi:hypothetical protein